MCIKWHNFLWPGWASCVKGLIDNGVPKFSSFKLMDLGWCFGKKFPIFVLSVRFVMQS